MKTTINILLLLIFITTFIQAQETAPKYGKTQKTWNKMLKEDWFNLKPNQLFAETIDVITPGAALNVATGEGRNTIFLAQKGWIVTGFDIANDDFIPTLAKSVKKDGLVVYEMGHRDFYLENWKNPGKWGCTEE